MDARPTRTSLPAELKIVPWPDAVIDRLGFPPHHPYSELVWLPAIGPASTLAWRRLGGLLEQHPKGLQLDVVEFSQALGLGTGTGANAPLSRTLRRLVIFELAIFVDESTYAVRRRIPPAPARHLRRLSPQLQRIHSALMFIHDAERGREEEPAPAAPGHARRVQVTAPLLRGA